VTDMTSQYVKLAEIQVFTVDSGVRNISGLEKKMELIQESNAFARGTINEPIL